MWDAGFPFRERVAARIAGYHRALCIYSVQHRGTHARPGLVLGLDRGGSCKGLAFRVAAAEAEATIAYLHEREMMNNAYVPGFLKTRLDDGRAVPAYAFVARRDHVQYTGTLSLERTVELVLQGVGPRGTALEYLENTVTHMDDLGIGDGHMHRILKAAWKKAGAD